MLRDDVLKSFVVGEQGVFGRLVRLGPSVDRIVRQHAYPAPVARLVAEATALAAVLAGGLKYDGVFSLQTKGDGPIGLLVADVTSGGDLRAYAQVDRARLEDVMKRTDDIASKPVATLLGAGYLAFTVDQGPETERYQGIVDLMGATFTDVARNYFRQSEQLASTIRLSAAYDDAHGWRAAAIALQRLPLGEARDPGARDDLLESWRTAEILMATAKDRDLLDADTPPEQLLFQLFHEPGVRGFESRALRHRCRCNEDRVLGILAAFTDEEMSDLTVDGMVTVTCQFCGREYRYADGDIPGALAGWREGRPGQTGQDG